METGTQVFELHRDTLRCGSCRYTCSDVLTFLAHKLQHSIGRTHSVYKCDLCQTFYDSNLRLESHYYNVHKVRLCFTHPENTDNKTEKEDVLAIEIQEPDNVVSSPESFYEYEYDADDYSYDSSDLESANEQNAAKSTAVDTKTEIPPIPCESVKECYVEVVKTEPDSENHQPKSSTRSHEKAAELFYAELETPFLLVTESKTVNSELQFQSWLVCIFCSQKFNNKQVLLKHIYKHHPNMKIEDLKVIDIDGTVKNSGIMIGKPSDAQYTKTLITLGEYNKLFTEEENNQYAAINEMENSILASQENHVMYDDPEYENPDEEKMKINSQEKEKIRNSILNTTKEEDSDKEVLNSESENITGEKLLLKKPIMNNKKIKHIKMRPNMKKKGQDISNLDREKFTLMKYKPVLPATPINVTFDRNKATAETPHTTIKVPASIKLPASIPVNVPSDLLQTPGATITLPAPANTTVTVLPSKHVKEPRGPLTLEVPLNHRKGKFTIAYIEQRSSNIINVQTACDEEINGIKFLLVTESSAIISNLYLKIWLVCLHCSHKSSSRNAFVNHMLAQHRSTSLFGIPNINVVLEKSGLLDNKPEEIKFTKTLMTIAEFDQFIPESNAESPEKDKIRDKACSKDKEDENNDNNEDQNSDKKENDDSEDNGDYEQDDENTDKSVGEKKKVLKVSTAMFSKKNKKKKKKRRLEKQDITGIFPCEKCGKEFSRLRYLRRHIRTHEEPKRYMCKICDKPFKTPDILRAHKKNVHNTDKTYRCKSCNFVSNINTAIHLHRQLHPESSVLCEICGKAYCDKSTLMKHMKVHDEARPYSCNWTGCRWRFKSELRLKGHYQTHTSQGKFVCQHCGYAFRRKQHLQRHETAIHGLPPPKPRPYRNQIVNDDLIEIPSEQLEINEAGSLIEPPMGMVAIGFNEQPIIYETSWSGTL